MFNNNNNNIHICIAPYGRNFRGAIIALLCLLLDVVFVVVTSLALLLEMIARSM